MLRQLGSSTGSASAANSAIAALVAPPIIDSNYATLELALAAVPSGGVLEVRTAWSRATSWTVNKPCTVRFVGAGSLTMTADDHGMILHHDDIRVEKPVITGTGATFGTSQGIKVKELAASPLNNITIVRGEISLFSRAGVDIENAKRVTVENVYIHDVSYAGIELLSVIGAMIRFNRIENITMPSGFVNAYGIGTGRDYSVSANPQVQDITIQGNYIKGVPTWEGIDTHAGINVRIVDNYIYNCKDHIAVIGGKNTSAVNTYAPRNVLIRGNHIDSGVTDGSAGNGIVINGVAGSSGVSLDPAVGIIVENNTVVGCGTDASGQNVGAIDFNNTKGIVVSGNTVIEPAYRGVNCYDTNLGAVITDNTVIDVWLNSADDGTSGAFAVRGNYNTPYISGNAAIRGTKTATLVHHRGLYNSSNTSGSVTLGMNNFDTATTPVADSSTVTTFFSRAKKHGFYSKTPIALPTANATDIATALVNVGLLPSGTTALGTAANSAATAFASPSYVDTAVAGVSTGPTYTPATATWHNPFPGSVGTSNNYSLNSLQFYPMLVPADMSVDSLQFETTVAASAGGVMRFAAYKATSGGLPDLTQLIKDFTQGGTVATDDAIGVHTVSFTAATLPRGLVYIAHVAQTAVATCRQALPFAPLFTLPSVGVPVSSAAFTGYTKTGVSGAPPTSGSLTANAAVGPVRIFLHTA